jgi:hypothetical protein
VRSALAERHERSHSCFGERSPRTASLQPGLHRNSPLTMCTSVPQILITAPTERRGFGIRESFTPRNTTAFIFSMSPPRVLKSSQRRPDAVDGTRRTIGTEVSETWREECRNITLLVTSGWPKRQRPGLVLTETNALPAQSMDTRETRTGRHVRSEWTTFDPGSSVRPLEDVGLLNRPGSDQPLPNHGS